MVAEELEAAPEPEGWVALELDAPEGCCVLEPAPAEPLMLAEPLAEPEGCALEPEEGAALDEDDDAPPALSFFWMSIEVDEELEPAPDGAVVGVLALPETEDEDEPAGALAEPDGAVDVLDELEAPVGLLLARSQPARTAAPNAMETARARVESFMWPPWLGYRLVSKDQAAFVT